MLFRNVAFFLVAVSSLMGGASAQVRRRDGCGHGLESPDFDNVF